MLTSWTLHGPKPDSRCPSPALTFSFLLWPSLFQSPSGLIALAPPPSLSLEWLVSSSLLVVPSLTYPVGPQTLCWLPILFRLEVRVLAMIPYELAIYFLNHTRHITDSGQLFGFMFILFSLCLNALHTYLNGCLHCLQILTPVSRWPSYSNLQSLPLMLPLFTGLFFFVRLDNIWCTRGVLPT